jgi:DNA modification methylase
VIVDEDDVHATAYALADNRTAELADWDDDVLAELLEELREVGDDPFDATGFTVEEVDEILERIGDGEGGDGEAEDDEIPEPPEEPISKPGDIWVCGRHRIVCGDSTDADVVQRVMQGGGARLCLTDPPYSVGYDASKDQRGGDANAHAGYIDPASAAELLTFLRHVPSDVTVMTYPIDRHFFALAKAMGDSGWEMRRELVWVKNRFSFWPSANYQQKHEPVVVAARKGKPLRSNVPANATTVIECDVITKHKNHPTERPTSLWSQLMKNHSDDGDVVFDPFSGSGTTMAVAEQLGRDARVIELSRQYVDVAVKRWENLTGEKATRVE